MPHAPIAMHQVSSPHADSPLGLYTSSPLGHSVGTSFELCRVGKAQNCSYQGSLLIGQNALHAWDNIDTFPDHILGQVPTTDVPYRLDFSLFASGYLGMH